MSDSIDGSLDPFDKIENFNLDGGIKSWPKPPDIDGVIKGCLFLQAFKKEEKDLSKPHFSRTMAFSVLAQLHDGSHESKVQARLLCQEFAAAGRELADEEYPVLDAEVEVALDFKPVTCAQVNAHRSECGSCPHFRKITSPIMIEGETFARSRYHGFWNIKIDAKGIPRKTSPDYHGLAKEFRREHEFVSISDQGTIYIYKDRKWELINELEIKAFIEEKLDPKPSETHRKEFVNLLKVQRHRQSKWFTESTDGLINLQNGIFKVETGELFPHSKEYGFTNILPYAYDAKAECPRFGKFLLDICSNDLEMVEVLQEYLGYAISNSKCYAEKALFLYGPTARNGKSTLIKVIQELVGRENYTSITLEALNKDTKRYMLENKLFNISEETNVRALADSEVFKTMVTGGELDVKKLYVQDYTIKNKAKLFVLCNELPRSGDRTEGLYRRMIVFHMRNQFSDEKGNRIADMDEQLLSELPGIFNFCVEGYKRLKENKFKFTQSKSTSEALDQYKVENDNVLHWFKENAAPASMDYFESKDLIYENYTKFCGEMGFEKPLNKNWFFRALKNIHPSIEEKRQANANKKQIRVIYGIKTLA